MTAPGIRHRRPGPRPSSGQGVKPWVVVLALVLAALVGLLLSEALQASTTEVARGSAASSTETGNAPGKNASGLPVVTESTLGAEAQRLVASGTTFQAPAAFDVNECLRQQGVTDSPIVMEEVEWGADSGQYWLIVHGPNERDSLRANGGIVDVTLVRPNCGTDGAAADQTLLWNGSTKIGSV
jgi:hypothetical protein